LLPVAELAHLIHRGHRSKAAPRPVSISNDNSHGDLLPPRRVSVHVFQALKVDRTGV
jgi:hypothetical protein